MTILKNLSMATTGAIFIALGTVGSAQAITLGFEGIGDVKPIGSFYNTEPQDFDIVFSPNALALIDKDAGGTGNIANEPSPNTALFFLQGSASTLNALNGFNMGFSFYYSASYFPGSIKVYDGLNATGNVLATLDLPKTPIGPGDPQGGLGDPLGEFSTFAPIGVTFTGVAKSIDFGGTANQIVFDNVTFGSNIPGVDPTPPGGTTPAVPFEFSPNLGLLILGAWGAIVMLKTKVQKRKVFEVGSVKVNDGQSESV